MLQRFSLIVATACRAVAAVLSAVMAVLITYVVYERFLHGSTPHWAEELPRMVMVWATFLGGVVCSFDRSHLMAGMLPFVVHNRRVLKAVERLNHLLIGCGMAALGWAGWELSLITMDQLLPAMPVSAGMVYLALPVGCALTVLVHLAQMFEPAGSDGAANN